MNKKSFFLSVICCSLSAVSLAQDTTNLMNDLVIESEKNKTSYIESTFLYTRIINGQSVENLPRKVLDVRISHRFGPLSSGPYNFFGLDYSPFNVRIGFDYGITDNFMIGGGHSGYQKTYDFFAKLKVLRQQSGGSSVPITISIVPTIAINSLKPFQLEVKPDSGISIKRLSYVFQVLIARKFSEDFSLQLMPTLIHHDNISFNYARKNILAIGIAGREKISKRMSVTGEYYNQLPDGQAPASHNVLSFGINIGTGGHVFQLLFSNSFGLTEKSFIAETKGEWGNGDELFGFNISRVFQLGKKR